MRFDLIAGDLEPMQLTLGGVTAIPAGSTATFTMKQVGGNVRITGPVVIDDPAQRIVHYQWAQGDTDLPGVYRAQVTVLTSGIPETFPSDEPLYIVIHPKL